MSTCGRDLYPDVTASGGLGPAMQEAAGRGGFDLGTLPRDSGTVTVETARGFVSVDQAAEERLFRVTVHIPGFAWRIGSTEDLRSLVEAIAAWRRGTSLDELRARFEFLELDEFSRAIEKGEPTASQWSVLLASEFHRKQWELLHRLRADEVLRTVYPTITHGAVRLQADPLDGASRQVLVQDMGAEQYEALRVGAADASWVGVAAGELIPFLRAAVGPW